jgi:hypothetical protein
MKIHKIGFEHPDKSSSYWTEVDKNTLIVGKIKTVADAKRLCKPYITKLPRPGEETLIDSGTVKLRHTLKDGRMTYYRDDADGLPRQYKTYLENNAGRFRVWTWISV